VDYLDLFFTKSTFTYLLIYPNIFLPFKTRGFFIMKKLGLIGIFLLTNIAFAAGVPATFTYQGIVMNSAGTAPLTSVVSLKLSIYDPTGACLLYQEQQSNIDLSQTNGTFAVQSGSAVGAAKRTGTDQGLAMTSVFANNGQILAASTTNCTTGYTPAANDIRLLRVAVTNGGSTVTISPDLQINSVPNAMVAETVQGYTLAQLRSAPTRTVITATGSGTYTVPAGTSYLEFEMVGGGGGGAGSGVNSSPNGNAGNPTTFGLSTASGGSGGSGLSGGAGVSGSLGADTKSGIVEFSGAGGAGIYSGSNGIALSGGTGGSSTLGGGGGSTIGPGFPANANSGGGGGGGGINQVSSNMYAGSGGSGGGYVKGTITNLAASYSYSVGSGGSTGSAGTSGNSAGAGGSGILIITAH
jgi:hypothetical protein